MGKTLTAPVSGPKFKSPEPMQGQAGQYKPVILLLLHGGKRQRQKTPWKLTSQLQTTNGSCQKQGRR